MPARGQLVDQRVVVAMRQVVLVLHADDLADPPRFGDLRRRDVAQPDVPHQTFLLQFGMVVSGASSDPLVGPWPAQIDDLEPVEAQVAQVVVHRFRQVCGRGRRVPRLVGAAPCAEFRDDDEVVRVQMQGFADQLVGDVRTVDIAGIDVVDVARHGLAQHGKRGRTILGRTEDAWAGELHCAVAETPHDAIAESESTRFFEAGHEASPFQMGRFSCQVPPGFRPF